MKLVRLRVEITAEDAVTVEQVQARLRAILDERGTEHIAPFDSEASGEDLAGRKFGPRVFWETADVKQGGERTETPARKRAAK
jgi:hypothetical protein